MRSAAVMNTAARTSLPIARTNVRSTCPPDLLLLFDVIVFVPSHEPEDEPREHAHDTAVSQRGDGIENGGAGVLTYDVRGK